MWKISPLAISLLLVVPFGIAVGVCWTALNVLRRVYRLDVPLFTLAGILMLLRFAPPILDGRMYTLGGFAMPGPGLAILVVASLAVIAISSNATLRRRSVRLNREFGHLRKRPLREKHHSRKVSCPTLSLFTGLTSRAHQTGRNPSHVWSVNGR